MAPDDFDGLALFLRREDQRQRGQVVDAREVEPSIAATPGELFLIDRGGSVGPDVHVDPAGNLFGPFVEAQPPDRVLLRRHFARLVDLALQNPPP